MDPLTHISAGLAVSLFSRPWFQKAKYFIPFCLLAAWIPDADIFFDGGDPEFSLLHHRGVTTSFIGGIPLAAAVAGLYKLVSKETKYLHAALLAYVLICVHTWLDLVNTYGTQILAPLSNHRFALDGAFIIDPILTLTGLILIAVALIMKSKRRKVAFFASLWFFAYPVMNMAIGGYLESAHSRKLTEQGVDHVAVYVAPDALTPRYWKAITDLGDQYRMDTIDLFGGEPVEPLFYQRASKDRMRLLGEQVSMFDTYAWFSRWPVVEETMTPEGLRVVFSDLRFTSNNPIMAAIFPEGRRPFVLEGLLSADGTVLDWNFTPGASSRSGDD